MVKLAHLVLLCLGLILTTSAQYETTLFYDEFTNLVVDAEISDGEYPTKSSLFSSSGVQFLNLYWMHNSSHIAIALSGELTGYIGFGLTTQGGGMLGANMIIASVEDDILSIGDYHGIGNINPVPDSVQHVTEANAAGVEEDGITTIEFIIPLSIEDEAGKDHSWEIDGEFGFFASAHQDSDALVYHTWHTDRLSVSIGSQELNPETTDLTIGRTANLTLSMALNGIFIFTLIYRKIARKTLPR